MHQLLDENELGSHSSTTNRFAFDPETHAVSDDIDSLDLSDPAGSNEEYAGETVTGGGCDNDGGAEENRPIADGGDGHFGIRSLAAEHGNESADGHGTHLEPDLENENENEEFPDTMIDKDEMMETSDDQDILGSPHSSFSYDDTLSDQEIDGLTNYNIILEYPQVIFENVQLLSFIEELNDWFSCKDLKYVKSIAQISKTLSVSDLEAIKERLETHFHNRDNESGKLLETLLNLSYISMGCFIDAKSQAEIKESIFANVIAMVRCDGLLALLCDIIICNSLKLTDCSNLEVNSNLVELKLLSNQFFFSMTILYIILLAFNTEELNHYDEKKILFGMLTEKDILLHLLKAIDRWKWISSTSENDDPSVVIESMASKTTDSEKIQVLVVTQFKIRNVLSLFNNLLLFQFGDLQHIQSTKDFLKHKFETNNDSECRKETARTVDEFQNQNDNGAVSETNIDDNTYSISSLDYKYYVDELLSRYPTYVPPKYETSEILELITKNENSKNISGLINVDSLLINQHQHLKNKKDFFPGFNNDPPDIHIATPMPSPTLTPQHTGNTRNCSNISEFEHSSNEIKKKLYITQSNFPNIYPSSDSVPKSIQDATNIFFHHIKDNYNTKQFTSVFEDFIKKENGYSDKDTLDKNEASLSNYIYTEKDIKENPMFEDEIRSLQNVEAFYRDGIPYMNSLIFVILKLLASNIIPSQQSSESGKTRQRTPYASKLISENKPYFSKDLTSFERQKLEVNRMKETLLKTSSSILFLIQKWFKLSHVLKFEYFTTLLFDQDYLIYLFRYLDSNKIQTYASKDLDIKDTKCLINNRIVYCDYKVLYYLGDYNFFMNCLRLSENPDKEFEIIDEVKEFESIFEKDENSKENVNPLSFILPFVPHNQVFTVVNPNKRCCISISNLLQVMYYTISHFKIQRIYKLIGVRPTEILRFYLTLHNKLFYSPILKTIKLISPFIGKKWRANNMDLISFVYLFHKVGLKDPWLNNFFNVGIEENTKRGFDNEVSLRSMIKFYNFQFYGEILSHHGFSEEQSEFMGQVEKLGGDFFAKECLDVGV